MPIEIIVKYSGDIETALAQLGGIAERLSSTIAIVTIDEDKIHQLANLPQIEYVEKPVGISLNMRESLYHACISTKITSDLTGQGVIVALLDSGIDYTHPDFRDESGKSRILYLWDMAAKGTPPPGFATGHLHTTEEINNMLSSPNPPNLDIIGHGTAVAGVAAGNGRAGGGLEAGVAPEAAIVAVKLGAGSKTIDLMRGLKFVADICAATSKPCAINISFGTNEGAHDGRSLFEEYVDEVADSHNIVVVVAAGNEGSAGHHFSGRLTTGQSEAVEFFVSGGATRVYLVLWKDFADIFTIEITPPTGQGLGENTQIYMGEPTHYNPDQLIFIELGSKNGFVPQGLWTLIITSISSVKGNYHIWLPTTEEVGHATAFARPTPDATITMPATATNPITVGAYNAILNSYAEFSGRGFVSGDLPIKPDLVAPGVNVLAAKAGGGYDTYSGTSIAAPFVTGAAALLMEWGIVQGNDPGLYGQRIKAYLHRGATRSPDRVYPNDRWGYGALCLETTLDYLQLQQHKPLRSKL